MFNWQESTWKSLTQNHFDDRLPHGLLFHGPKGIGKNVFATSFANWLLCEQPSESSTCGKCKSCLLVQAKSHPDLVNLVPEEEGKSIKVDQIRELIQTMSLSHHTNGYRVIIVSPADSLNINASNSLLKTLEEPSDKTVIILVTDQSSKLMPTIRSRTQMVRFDIPDEQLSLNWLKDNKLEDSQAKLALKLSAGAPLASLKLAEGDGLALRTKLFENWQALANNKADALESAAFWLKDGFRIHNNLPLYWVSSWINDMILYLQSGDGYFTNIDYSEALQNLARQVDLKALYGLLDRLNDTLRLEGSPANQLMLIEAILLHWSGLKRR
ncbi:MAG: DNA polymerase III subunit delta' [Woeseiaceae bacterium]